MEMSTCDVFVAMKQDIPKEVGDEGSEDNPILRYKIVINQFQNVMKVRRSDKILLSNDQ